MKRIICILVSLLIMVSLLGCQAKESKNISLVPDTSIVFFETDNDADCALIKCDDISILIDTGEKDDGNTIVKYLQKNGISRLDYIIFSHFDKDHCSGALKILEKIKVNEVLHPKFVKESEETSELFSMLGEKYIRATEISDYNEFDLGSLCFKLYPAEKATYVENQSNNSSLVAMVEIQGVRALFTGDCQEERVQELIDSNEDFNADILKLMYHGREVNNEVELIEKIRPKYTVITADNDKKKVKKNIEKIGDSLGTYYFTGNGTITFIINDGEITLNQKK